MDEELAIIQSAKDKIATANRRKDVAILNQVLEPIVEAMSELKEALEDSIKVEKKEQVYFDKDFNAKLITSLNKVFDLIKSLKQPELNIDLSPITAIATEIRKGNDSIISLLSKPNQSEELYRMISATVGKQNILIEKGFQQINYSDKIDGIIEALNKKDNRVEELNIIYQEGGTIKKVIPIYKK